MDASGVFFTTHAHDRSLPPLLELDPASGEASVYRTRDLVPAEMMHLLSRGRVLVTNWHIFEPQQMARVGDDGARVVKAGVPVEEVGFTARFLPTGHIRNHCFGSPSIACISRSSRAVSSKPRLVACASTSCMWSSAVESRTSIDTSSLRSEKSSLFTETISAVSAPTSLFTDAMSVVRRCSTPSGYTRSSLSIVLIVSKSSRLVTSTGALTLESTLESEQRSDSLPLSKVAQCT